MKSIYKILCISLIALLLDIPYLIYFKDTFMNMIYRVQGGQSFNFRFIYLIPIYILIGIVIYYYVFSGLKANKEYNTNYDFAFDFWEKLSSNPSIFLFILL